MIKAAIFDLDDTLYDFWTADALGKERVRAYAAEHLGVDGDLFLSTFIEMMRLQFRLHPDSAGCHDRAIRAQLACEKLGLPIRHALDVENAYWNAFLTTIVPFDGIHELFDNLHAAGKTIGVCTNMTCYWQIKKLIRLGLADKCDFLVTSEEANVEKPGRAIFELCLEKAKCAPEECIFVGDNADGDIRGAAAAGMNALLILSNGSLPEGFEFPYVTSARDIWPFISSREDF